MASEITPPLTEAEEQALGDYAAAYTDHYLTYGTCVPVKVLDRKRAAAVAAIRAAERERVLREVEEARVQTWRRARGLVMAYQVAYRHDMTESLDAIDAMLAALRGEGGDRDA